MLDRAALVFWRHGFEATSIQDLEEATGLGRGSLYNSFGDKAALFRAVLARYGETEGAPPCVISTKPMYLPGCRAYCMRSPRGWPNPDGRAAAWSRIPVLLVAVALPLTHKSLKVCAPWRRPLNRVLRAQDQGQLASGADPLRLARFYCAVVQSLGLMHRALGDAATLQDIVQTALSAWPKS